VLKVATPPVNVPVPIAVPPFKNVTVSPFVVKPFPLNGARVAVSVTAWPTKLEVGLAVSVRVVVGGVGGAWPRLDPLAP
jgi:hypothetical protein